MLIIRRISAGVVDYYLPTAVDRSPGQWHGGGCAALGLTGQVGRRDLAAILHGRHPSSGEYLPRVRPARRRAGWDLMFSAPKSVSLLGALEPSGLASVHSAHSAAVADVMGHLESELLSVDRSQAPGGREPTSGAVSAHFDHEINAAGEPHVHTHVLLANLGQGRDGAWSAVGGSQWKVWRAGLFSLYSMGLRHHLEQQGWDLDWRLRPDGLADIAGISRAAVRSVSSQAAAVSVRGRYEARRQAVVRPWMPRLDASTLELPYRDPEPPHHGSVRHLAADQSPHLVESVTNRLIEHRSTFRDADVLVALAASNPDGARPGEAMAWVRHFCSQAIPVDSSWATPRWTTEAARLADQRLLQMGHPGDDATRSIDWRQLADSSRPIEILGSRAGVSALLPHSATLQACFEQWNRAGLEVAVDCRRERDVARWGALTGIPKARLERAPDVLVVDQADRRSTPELLALVIGAVRRGGRVVMIEGGTMPRLSEPSSLGFDQLGDHLGRVAPSREGGHRAVDELASRWLALDRDRDRALLVGLGPDEATALNLAARHELVTSGALGRDNPTLLSKDHRYQAGDRVMLLRPDGTDRRRGCLGAVREVCSSPPRLEVEWDDHARRVYRGGEIRVLGYGYATTPDLAARQRDASLLVLGHDRDVPALAERVIAWAAAPHIESGVERDRRTWLGLGL